MSIRCMMRAESQAWYFEDAQSDNDITLHYNVPPHEARPVGEDEFEYLAESSPLDIEWKNPSQSLSRDARHVEYKKVAPESHLCNACLSALGYLAQNLKDCIAHAGDKTFETKKSVVQHQNLMAFFAAANGGCHLCKTIWDRRFKTSGLATAEDIRIDFCWNTTDEQSWDGRCPGDARLLCNMVSTNIQSQSKHTWDTIFRFQLWPSALFDDFFKVEGSVSLDPIERGNTRSCRPMALHWLSECRANVDGAHSECQASNVSWYPTRLLDLSTLEKTGKVLLMVTDLLDQSSLGRSKYVTLSHCWGAWGAKELPVLTTSNIDVRVDHGMDISLLPPTFKDAIEVARWLNIEWLWIDSLCILQDSRDDWQREAPMMCDVYQNAFLNISADHAVDARDGLFRDRFFATVAAFKLDMKPLQSTWWVAVDERNLFEWVKDAPSSERAWIYQERHLARRVLHFTEHEVFWECRAAAPSFRSETYPRGSPLRRDFLGQTKLRLNDTSDGLLCDNPYLMVAWNTACRGYSRRKLTNPTDKLPALSGLARDFGSRCQEDTYVAGMWLSQLPRSLFWNSPVRERPGVGSPPTKSGAPSWSWMSCAGPMETSNVEDSYYVTDLVTILLNYRHKTADPYGEIERACLYVHGFVRRITSVMKEIVVVPGDGANRQIDTSRKYRHLYVDGQLDRDIGYGADGHQQFAEMPDWFPGFAPVEYHCLFLAVSQKEPRDNRTLRGLLLEPVGPEGTFRRVGHMFCHGRCALQMRYQLRPGETDEAGAWERLWELVAPYSEGLVPAVTQVGGPRALYELDGPGADDASFLQLEPRMITLV